MSRRALPSKRFQRLVNYDGPVNPKTGTPCHLWLGEVKGGYGTFKLHPRISVAAHRFAYEQKYGQLPVGYFVDHEDPSVGCGRQLCVNAEHMRACTPFGGK